MEKNEIANGFEAFLKGTSFTPSTREAYRFCLDRWRHFLSEAGVTSFKEITCEMVDRFVADRRARSITDGTIRRDVGALRSAWAFLGDYPRWQVSRKCPVRVPHRRSLELAPARGRCALPLELPAIRAECRQDYQRQVVTIAAETGLTDPEIRDLQWTMVYLDDREIRFAARRIPLSGAAMEVLKSIRPRPRIPWVFTTQDGAKLKRISSWWIGAKRRAGVKDLRFQDLRHTFVVNYVKTGGDIRELPEILGVTKDTVARYLQQNFNKLCGPPEKEFVTRNE